jgi:hypothetical protein
MMSSAEIPPIPASILKRKSNIIRTIDTTRHTLETRTNDNGISTTSIVKRPSNKSLVTVPVLPEKRFAHTGKVYEHEDNFADEAARRYDGKRWDEHWKSHPKQLEEMNHENYQHEAVAKYEFNHHPDRVNIDEEMCANIKNRKKQKRCTGTWFPDYDKPIYDAKYSEIVDDAVRESSKFRKAPSRDARELGLAKKSKSVEPAGIKAISKRKQEIKYELLNFNPIKPSKPARNNRNGDDWLIDEAFEHVAKAGKAVVKAGKATGVIAGEATKAVFHATKKGIQGFNEISDEIVKNPMLKNMAAQHEATLAGMASQRRHARGSIVATGKKSISSGSLVKQHGYVAHSNTQVVAPQTANRLRVTPKIVHRRNGDAVLYFLEDGRQVSRAQARLIQEGILPPALANKASTTIAQANLTYNTNQLDKKPEKSVSGLVTRNQSTNRTLNKSKVATASGLVRRTHPGVV